MTSGRKLIAALTLAAIAGAGAAHAGDALICGTAPGPHACKSYKEPNPAAVGTWCFVTSSTRDATTGEWIGASIYSRGRDCPKNERLVIGPKGLPGHKLTVDENGTLIVEKEEK